MHPVGKLLSPSATWLRSSWWIVLLLPLATAVTLGVAQLVELEGSEALALMLALLVAPVVGTAVVREHIGANTLAEEGARLSMTLLISSTAWCAAVALGMWVTFECACPAEVYTPGRGWHYNDGCFCGFEFAGVGLVFAVVVLALLTINGVCWSVSAVRAGFRAVIKLR